MSSALIIDLLTSKGFHGIKSVENVDENLRSGNLSENECVHVRFKEGGNEGLNLFLKICKKGSRAAVFEPILAPYEREITFYNDIVPFLVTFQLERLSVTNATAPISLLFLTYYGSTVHDESIYIVLEKICENQFYLVEKDEGSTHERIKCVLKCVAGFHSVSYCMQVMENIDLLKKFPILQDRIVDPAYRDHSIAPLFKLLLKEAVRMVTVLRNEATNENPRVKNCDISWKHLSEGAIERVGNVSDHMMDILYHICSSPGETGVMCHGDYHAANIAFNKDVKSQTKMFDFQFVHYGSAMLDILKYLFLSVPSKVRSDNLEEYLMTYCDEFNSQCNVMGLEIETNSFTYDNIMKEYKRTAPWGFIFGLILRMYNAVGTDRDKLASFKNSDVIEKFERCEKFRWGIGASVDLIIEAEREGCIDVMEQIVVEKLKLK